MKQNVKLVYFVRKTSLHCGLGYFITLCPHAFRSEEHEGSIIMYLNWNPAHAIRNGINALQKLRGLRAQLSTQYWRLPQVSLTRVTYIPRFYTAVTRISAGRTPTLNLPYAFIGLIISQNTHLPHSQVA